MADDHAAGEETGKERALAFLRQGLLALKDGDVKQARISFVQAKDLDPKNADIWVYLTLTTYDPKRRVQLLQRALSIDPQHERAQKALATLMAAEQAPETTGQPTLQAPEGDDRCPQCGAVLRMKSQAGDRVCIFCGYGMQAGTAEFVTPIPLHPPQQWPPNRRARSCLGCEVVFLLPTGLPADTACPVCMEPVWQEVEIAAAYPDRVVPFRVDEARAVAALQGAKLNGHSLTQLFGSKRELTRPRPVLLPLWVFSGTGVVHFMPGPVERSFQHSYDAVPVFGTRQLGSQLLTVAADLPLEEAEPCTGAIAADTLVFLLLPDVPLQRAAQEASRRMLRDLRLRALNSQSGAIADSAMADFGVEQVLLPAWIGEVRVGGRGYSGLVNGYTGAVELSALVRDERR